MEANNGEVTNMNNNNNTKQERSDASPLTRRLGSGRAGSGGRLDDASWIQTRESRSREPSLLHTLQRDKSTPKRLSTGSDDSGWIKSTSSSTTRRSTGSDDLWLRSPQRMRRVTTDSWSSSSSGSGASGAAAGAASEAGSAGTRSSASGASSGATSSVMNRWNASILEPGKLRIKAEDAKSWIKSDIKDTRSGSGRLQHNPEPIRAIHVPDLALRSTDTQPVREAKLRPSDMGDVKLRLQSFEQGILQSDSAVRTRERSRDRDRSRDREAQLKSKEESFTPRTDILKSAIAKFDMASGSSNKNTNKTETDEAANWKYERRLRTVRTGRKKEEVCGDDKDGIKATENGNQAQTDRSSEDQAAISRDGVTVITGVNQGDPDNAEIENISVPHECSNPTVATEAQEEGVVSTLEGTSRTGRRRRRHDPPIDREERMPIKEARMRGHDDGSIEVDSSIKGQEGALTVTDSSTVTHRDTAVKGVDTVTVTDSITTIENTDSCPTSTQDTIQTGAEVEKGQITHQEDLEYKEHDFVPTEETYTAQGSITLSSVSPTSPHTDTVTLKNREAIKEVQAASNDEVERLEETGARGEDTTIQDNSREEHETTKYTDIKSTTTTTEFESRGRHTEDGAGSDQEEETATRNVNRNVEVTQTTTEDYKAEVITKVVLKEDDYHNKEEGTRTEDEAPEGERTTDVSQDQEEQVLVTEVMTEVTCITQHAEGDDMVTEASHVQSNLTSDIENTVTNDIKIGVTNDIESSVTNDNDLEDVSEIQEDTLEVTTVGLTHSAPRSDSTDTESPVQGGVLEAEAIVVVDAQSDEGAGEVRDTGRHAYTDTHTSIHSGHVQGGDVQGGDVQSGDVQPGDVQPQDVQGEGVHVGDGRRRGGSTSDAADPNESVASIVTEDVKYVTDDSDSNDDVTDKACTQTTITVSQQHAQGENLHDGGEESPSGEGTDVINVEVLEGGTQREVVEGEIEPQVQGAMLCEGDVSVSDTGFMQEPTEVALDQEEHSPRASSNKTTLSNEDINLVEDTAPPQSVQGQGEVVTPTEDECDSFQGPTRDTMVTTETIQLRYDGKTEEESAIKIIVTQIKDIRGESEEDEVEGDHGECRESEEVTEVVTVRESGDSLNNEGNIDLNSDKAITSSVERHSGSEPSGTDVINLAQGDVGMTSAGEHGDETESQISRQVDNEPNGVYSDHYHVGGQTGDNAYRTEEVGASKTTQAEQIQIPTQDQPIKTTPESTPIDMSTGDLTIGVKRDQDSAVAMDDTGLSNLCEDYVYVDTPPAHSDEEAHHHQIGHGSKTGLGSFGSHHEMDVRAGFDVNEDDDNSTEQEPEAVNVESSMLGNTQRHTWSDVGEAAEQSECGGVDEEEMAAYTQDYTELADNTTDNLTQPQELTQEQACCAVDDDSAVLSEDDSALLSQGYTRLGDDDDDDDTGTTQVIYMDDVEIPSDDSNSEGGEYAENDTEEETLDSDEQEDTDSDGGSERIEYPWGVERAWGLETIEERPEVLDSDREEERRAPLAQMDSSDDDEEWIEEYTFIHHEPEEPQPGGSQEQGGDTGEETPLITTDTEMPIETEPDIAVGSNPEESKEESSHEIEYIDESLQEGIVQDENINRETPQGHSEPATSEGMEEHTLEEGVTEQHDAGDVIPQLTKSLTSQQDTTRDSHTVCKPCDEQDHDAVDGSVSSSLHLMKNVNLKEETESGENDIIKTESLTTHAEQDSNNNQTSVDVAQSDDQVTREVAEVMSLAVLSEAILSLQSSPQETTEASHIEKAPLSAETQSDDRSSKLTDESVIGIVEAISSIAISEAILCLPKEKITLEETSTENVEETKVSLGEAKVIEASHVGISDDTDHNPEETEEVISDMIISEASISLQSSPIVEDGLADDDVRSADSEEDSAGDDSSEGDSQRPETINDATLGVIAEYMSSEVMSEVLVSLQSHLEELEDDECEALESHSVETEAVVCEETYQHERVGGATCETPGDLGRGTVDVGLVEDVAEGMSRAVMTDSMASVKTTLQQTATEDASENASEDDNTLNGTTETILDEKLHSASPSDHPHVEDQGIDSLEVREMNVESLDSLTQEAEQEESAVEVAITEMVGSAVETGDISEAVTVSKEAEVRPDLPSSTESAKGDADSTGQQVQEISQMVQADMVASCRETESFNDEKTPVARSVDSVTIVTTKVTSEGHTKDKVQSASEVPPSNAETGSNDTGSVGGVINIADTAVKNTESQSATDAISETKSKTPTKVTCPEECGTPKAHIIDIQIEPGLSKRERTRLLRETRSRLSRTVTRKDQERSQDEARYRRPRKPPPTEEQLQMKQLVTWLSSSPARTGDTKHTKMLNGDDDVCYDTLILEVFEESDSIFFPLVQQKEARAFIKALHMKGVPYEALCQEVGEHEHNFTSWRKSLGRAGIGHSVMQWANRPLQDLLDDEEEQDEDDGMDDADLRADQERQEEEERLREEEAQRRLQGDKVKKEVDHNKNDQKDAHDQNNTSAAKSNGVTMRRPKETSPPPTQTKTGGDVKPPRQKYEQEPDLIRLRRLEEFKRTQDKTDAEPVQDIRKRISLFEKQQSPSKSGSESREDSENGEGEEESRTETESISSGSMDEPTESSPEPPSEPRPKSPEPPVVVEEVVTVKQEAVVEETPHSNGRSTRDNTPRHTSPPPTPADDNKPTRDHTDSSSGSSGPDVNENYNSDLDPDNDMHSPVQAIAAKKIASSRINKTWSGFIFVFSDTPANSDTCRVKVGASAFPHKRLRQAQLFNPDMYQVHTVAVKQRSAALEQVLAELDPYRLSGQKDWFEGPFNDLLAAISDVAARFPSSRKIIDSNADDGDGESAC